MTVNASSSDVHKIEDKLDKIIELLQIIAQNQRDVARGENI
jgi:hypothetical protein